MKERPILFSGEMVKAILDGRKTQTRRVIKTTGEAARYTSRPQPASGRLVYKDGGAWDDSALRTIPIAKCPYGIAGDSLWVRETWTPDCATVEGCRASFEDLMPGCSGPYYRADASDFDIETLRWKPSIHMPRWASRINLEIAEIRVEQLQDISIMDCFQEGVLPCEKHIETPEKCIWIIEKFCRLWGEINGKPRADGIDISWKANPWVWVVTFQKEN